MQAANLIRLGQLEPELLGVVVDILNTVELQRDEALFATGESWF